MGDDGDAGGGVVVDLGVGVDFDGDLGVGGLFYAGVPAVEDEEGELAVELCGVDVDGDGFGFAGDE